MGERISWMGADREQKDCFPEILNAGQRPAPKVRADFLEPPNNTFFLFQVVPLAGLGILIYLVIKAQESFSYISEARREFFCRKE